MDTARSGFSSRSHRCRVTHADICITPRSSDSTDPKVSEFAGYISFSPDSLDPTGENHWDYGWHASNQGNGQFPHYSRFPADSVVNLRVYPPTDAHRDPMVRGLSNGDYPWLARETTNTSEDAHGHTIQPASLTIGFYCDTEFPGLIKNSYTIEIISHFEIASDPRATNQLMWIPDSIRTHPNWKSCYEYTADPLLDLKINFPFYIPNTSMRMCDRINRFKHRLRRMIHRRNERMASRNFLK